MSTENKGRVRILRANSIDGNVGDVKLYDGQPFYDKSTGYLYIGDGEKTIANSNPVVAKYASSDTTKGTIEERLTNLGFKQGSMVIGSDYTESTYGTITTSLIKQGNMVIGQVNFATGGLLGKYDLTYGTRSVNTIATIPEGFRPDSQTTAYIYEEVKTTAIPYGTTNESIFTTRSSAFVTTDGLLRGCTYFTTNKSGDVSITDDVKVKNIQFAYRIDVSDTKPTDDTTNENEP